MNLTDFHQSVLRTCTVPGESSPDGSPTPFRQLVWACGLAGETGELLEAIQTGEHIATEAGDVLWYIGALAFAAGSNIAALHPAPDPELRRVDVEALGDSVRRLVIAVGKAVDLVKKHHGHGSEFKRAEFICHLTTALNCLDGICWNEYISLEEVAAKNDAKLRVRWPGGFRP